MRQAELVILIVVSVLTGCGCKKQEGQVKSNRQYKIAFVSRRDGNDEIYVMNADGSEQKRLTNTPTLYERYLRWSPDGTKIGFVSWRQSGIRIPWLLEPKMIGTIYVMNADGSGKKQLTDRGRDWNPVWSPVPLPAQDP